MPMGHASSQAGSSVPKRYGIENGLALRGLMQRRKGEEASLLGLSLLVAPVLRLQTRAVAGTDHCMDFWCSLIAGAARQTALFYRGIGSTKHT